MDWKKFLISRFVRGHTPVLHCRSAVHIVRTAAEDDEPIPGFVRWYIARGLKYIEPQQQPTTLDLLKPLALASSALHTQAFFKDRPGRHRDESFRKARLRTSWQPPQNQHIARWYRLLRAECLKCEEKGLKKLLQS